MLVNMKAPICICIRIHIHSLSKCVHTDGNGYACDSNAKFRLVDVTDGHFVYIYSAIFRHQTDLFYCAQDIGVVVCPFIYHYATHTANGFRAVRDLWNHCAAERTCRFVSRWSGAYFIPIRSMFGRVGCIAHVIYRNEYNPGT